MRSNSSSAFQPFGGARTARRCSRIVSRHASPLRVGSWSTKDFSTFWLSPLANAMGLGNHLCTDGWTTFEVILRPHLTSHVTIFAPIFLHLPVFTNWSACLRHIRPTCKAHTPAVHRLVACLLLPYRSMASGCSAYHFHEGVLDNWADHYCVTFSAGRGAKRFERAPIRLLGNRLLR